MTYENIIVAIAACLYFSVAVLYAVRGQWPWSFVWLCYSMVNIGLILVEIKK